MIYVLILLYIFNSQVTLEKAVFETEKECLEVGNKRIEDQYKDPRFQAGLYANCVELPGQAIKS